MLLLAGCRSSVERDIARYDYQTAQAKADGLAAQAQAQAAAAIAQSASETEQRRLDAVAAQAVASAAIANSNAAIAQSENGYKIVKVQEETDRAQDFNQYLPWLLLIAVLTVVLLVWLSFRHRQTMKVLDIKEKALYTPPPQPQRPITPLDRQIPAGVVKFALEVGANEVAEAHDGTGAWFVYVPNTPDPIRLEARPKLLTVNAR